MQNLDITLDITLSVFCLYFADCLRRELEGDGRLLLDPLYVPHPQRVPGQRGLHHRHRPRQEGLPSPRRSRHTRHGILPVGPVHPRVPGKTALLSLSGGTSIWVSRNLSVRATLCMYSVDVTSEMEIGPNVTCGIHPNHTVLLS